jgi:hypothetical protein
MWTHPPGTLEGARALGIEAPGTAILRAFHPYASRLCTQTCSIRPPACRPHTHGRRTRARAQFVNFRFVPPRQRILFVNVIGVGWAGVLSHMAAHKVGPGP